MLRAFSGRESGMTLIETLAALAVLGTIAICFLSGLVTTSKATFIIEEQATAENIARSQMEWVKNTDYTVNATQYSPAPIPSGSDYINYSANITVEPLHATDDGIQTITITVIHSDEQVFTLEGYKLDR